MGVFLRRSALLTTLLTALLVACGGSEDSTPEASATPVEGGVTAVLTPTGSPLDGPYPRYVDEAAGLVVRLGTPDLAVGEHRLSFVLSDEQGVVSLPVVQVRTHRFDDGPLGVTGETVEELTARHYPFPDGIRGLYVLDHVEFTEAGTWGLAVDVPRPDGSVAETTFAFEVRDEPLAVAVGEEAPRSANRTAADVERLTQLSTGAEPDPALYEQTITEALDSGRPLVAVFASPGFCTNALCGPQVEMLTTLRERWGDQVNFIHVDLYTNPEEIRTGGLENRGAHATTRGVGAGDGRVDVHRGGGRAGSGALRGVRADRGSRACATGCPRGVVSRGACDPPARE